jgi:hypothetical protein
MKLSAKLAFSDAMPDVAHAGEVETGADGMPVHGCDHGHLQVEQAEGEPLDAAPVLVPDVDLADVGRRLPLHLADVAAGAERGTVPGQDHAAHAVVVVDSVDGREELGHRGVAGERIALLRLVHGQRDERAVLLVDQKVGHLCFSNGLRSISSSPWS